MGFRIPTSTEEFKKRVPTSINEVRDQLPKTPQDALGTWSDIANPQGAAMQDWIRKDNERKKKNASAGSEWGGDPNAAQIAVGEHLGTAPEYGDIYGGEYDPEQFGWDRGSFEFDPESDWYDPTRLGSEGYELTELEAQNFDPYRRNALQDVSATSASGLESALGGLARTTGVTAADRMALASQNNRDKIAGRSRATGEYDEMESKNIYDVGNRNSQIANEAAAWNAQQRSEADRTSAEQAISTRDKETEAENLYNKGESERIYQEKLDKYNADLERWYLEGQFMAGGAVKPKPPQKYGEEDAGPGEDAVIHEMGLAGAGDSPFYGGGGFSGGGGGRRPRDDRDRTSIGR